MKTSTKIMIGLGLLAVAGGVGFYLYNKNKNKTDEKKDDTKKKEEESVVKESKIEEKKETQKTTSATLSQTEADKIAKEIETTKSSEKTMRLNAFYVSPNVGRLLTLKSAGYDYSNGKAVKTK